jgi:hypothetical protein
VDCFSRIGEEYDVMHPSAWMHLNESIPFRKKKLREIWGERSGVNTRYGSDTDVSLKITLLTDELC